jgi:hypothetical protein
MVEVFEPASMWENQQLKVTAKVALWLAVYHQSVRLGAKPLEDHGHRYFSTEPLRS